jgi:hypothetical protein
MPKAMFEELGYPALSPTTMTVQLADSSVKYPEGIVENLLVNVTGSYVFAVHGPRHIRRNSAYSRATIPKRCQCKD